MRVVKERGEMTVQQILYFHLQGYKAPTIAKLLQEEGMSASSRQGIAKFLKRYLETGTVPANKKVTRATRCSRITLRQI